MRPNLATSLFSALLLCIFCALVPRCVANTEEDNIPKVSEDNPIEIEADFVEYAQEDGNIIARGNVVITFAGNTLETEEIIYNRDTKIITAPTLVFIEDYENNEYNASRGTIYADWDNSEIEDVIAVLAIKGEIHASKVVVLERGITEAHDVKYTMCDVCNHSFDLPKPPLWSLYSSHLKRDTIQERITVKNSVLKAIGIPIFYFPYLSFPTPGASRQSGLLTPVFKWERDFGLNVKIPIYFSLRPEADLTVTPWVMEHFGDQISAHYRYLTRWGQYEVIASGAKTSTLDENGNINMDRRKGRGHIHSFGHFDIPHANSHSSVDYTIFRLKDELKTYLKKYHISDQDILTSNFSYHFFRDKEYVTLDAIQFQGLRDFDSFAITPQAYPKFQYYKLYYLKPGLSFSYLADFLHLYRSQGRNLRRGVMEGKLEGTKREYAYNFEYFASIRGDYYYSDVNNPYGNSILEYNTFRMLDIDTETVDGFRIFPSGGVKFSMPFYAKYKDKKFLLQPTLAAIISPTISRDKQFVNEDSQSPELHIENLFLPNVYKGFDKIQDGSRMMYSLRSLYNQGQYKFFLEFGQLYTFHRNSEFDASSGLIDCYSDFVSIFSIKYADFIEFMNKLRVDKSNFNFENNETSLYVNYNKLNLNIDFYGLGKKTVADTDLKFRNELHTKFGWKLHENWQLNYSNRSHVGSRQENEKKLIAHEVSLVYKGKCLKAAFSIEKHFTRLNDYTPSTNYSFSVNVPIN